MSSDRVAYVYVGDGSFTRVSEAALPGVATKSEEELRTVVGWMKCGMPSLLSWESIHN